MFGLFKKSFNAIKFMPCINEEEISNLVVRDLLLELKNNNSLNIGFAGNECLKHILSKFAYNIKKHQINYSNINFFNLIEFNVVVEDSMKYPFAHFMMKEFYSKLKIASDHIYEINENSKDKIKDKLHSNNFDVLVIEVGIDGHVCLNNRKLLVDFSFINKVKLNDSTREEYVSLFAGKKSKIPLYGFCVNFKTILEAKKIIVVSSGNYKASVTAKFLEQNIDHSWNATYLIKNKNLTLYADLGALELVNK